MANKISNLVRQQTTGTGTGNLTTIAPTTGVVAFSAAFGTGTTTNVFRYFISHQSAVEWEIGTGHMSATNTFVRDTIIHSSNANALVSFSAGTKNIVCDEFAEIQGQMDQLYTDKHILFVHGDGVVTQDDTLKYDLVNNFMTVGDGSTFVDFFGTPGKALVVSSSNSPTGVIINVNDPLDNASYLAYSTDNTIAWTLGMPDFDNGKLVLANYTLGGVPTLTFEPSLNSVTSAGITLDDGAGNMNISNSLTVNGASQYNTRVLTVLDFASNSAISVDSGIGTANIGFIGNILATQGTFNVGTGDQYGGGSTYVNVTSESGQSAGMGVTRNDGSDSVSIDLSTGTPSSGEGWSWLMQGGSNTLYLYDRTTSAAIMTIDPGSVGGAFTIQNSTSGYLPITLNSGNADMNLQTGVGTLTLSTGASSSGIVLSATSDILLSGGNVITLSGGQTVQMGTPDENIIIDESTGITFNDNNGVGYTFNNGGGGFTVNPSALFNNGASIEGFAGLHGAIEDPSFSQGTAGQVATATGTSSWNWAFAPGASVSNTDLTTQSAAISSSTIFSPTSTGFYQISLVASITRAASTSSVLGGANGFQIGYNDGGVGKVTPVDALTSNSGNTTGTCISKVIMIHASSGTNVSLNFGYTSVGVTTMQYDLHLRILKL